MKPLIERVLRTGAATLLSLIVAAQTDLLSMDWIHVLSLTAGAMVISILKNAPTAFEASITYRNYWVDLAERALSTAAQSALVVMGGELFDILNADYKNMMLTVGMATLVSVLSSLAGKKVGDPNSASLLPEGDLN